MEKIELLHNILRSAQTHQYLYAGYHDIQIETSSFRGDLWIKVMLFPRNAQNGKLQYKKGGEVDLHYWVFRESDEFETTQKRFQEMNTLLSDPKNFNQPITTNDKK